MSRSSDTQGRLGLGAYIALLVAILFFSGIFKNADNFLRFLDFSTLVGMFGSIATDAGKSFFTGTGGAGAKDGFLFGVSLVPPAMLAMAAIRIVEYYGALEAARRLLTPVLKPLLGIPGVAGLTLIASLQNVDAGGGMTRDLYKEGEITDKERSVFVGFQLAGGGVIVNYFGTGAALFLLTTASGEPAITASMIIPFIVVIAFKVVAANMMRLYLMIANKLTRKGSQA